MRKFLLFIFVFLLATSIYASNKSPNFRNVYWGQSVEKVMEFEENTLLDYQIMYQDSLELTYLFYEEKTFRTDGTLVETVLFYKFINNWLCKAGYWFTDVGKAEEYLKYYNELQFECSLSFGCCTQTGYDWLENLSEIDRSVLEKDTLEAIKSGLMKIFTIWKFENNFIYLYLKRFGNGNYDLGLEVFQ